MSTTTSKTEFWLEVQNGKLMLVCKGDSEAHPYVLRGIPTNSLEADDVIEAAQAALDEIIPQWEDRSPRSCHPMLGLIIGRMVTKMKAAPADDVLVQRGWEAEAESEKEFIDRGVARAMEGIEVTRQAEQLISDMDHANNGELTDQQLIDAIIRLRDQKRLDSANLKMAEHQLEMRMRSRSGRPIVTETHEVTLAPKPVKTYDQDDLMQLRMVVTDSMVWNAVLGTPRTGVLNDIADMSQEAEEIIARAIRIEQSDEDQLKIKTRKGGPRSSHV